MSAHRGSQATRRFKLALVGNPNVGKSVIYNEITGGDAWVGNWPGTTVEKKVGRAVIGGVEFEVVDLPGIYSLSAYTLDEEVAVRFLVEEKPDLVVVILNAVNLERSLYLLLSVLEVGVRVVAALNMIDLAEGQGYKVRSDVLEELLGIRVIPTVAVKGVGIEELRKAILDTLSEPPSTYKVNYGVDVERAIEGLASKIKGYEPAGAKLNVRWLASRLLEEDKYAVELVERLNPELLKVAEEHRRRIEKTLGRPLDEYVVERRYEEASKIASKALIKAGVKKLSLTSLIDYAVTHKVFGIPIMLTAVYLMFRLAFDVATPLCTLVDYAFSSYLPSLISSLPMPEFASSLIGDGVVAGVGSVLIFLPNIALLFLALALLEDVGYLARAAFVVDKVMHKLKLTGKSIIPLLLGFGCNIPGVMATRAIEDEQDRKTTALATPVISCAARLPVYLVFAGALFTAYRGSVVFSMYLWSVIFAALTAIILRKALFKGVSTGFIIELPPYMAPQAKSVCFKTWLRCKRFLLKAGTVIVAVVVVVWLLSVTGPSGYLGVGALEDPELIEQSWIGVVGHWLEPIFTPMGWDWRASSALLVGFLAKEAVVGAMGVLYGVGEEGLSGAIASSFTPLTAYAYMLFVLLYVPCVATLATIRGEMGFKYALLALAYELALAYSVAALCVGVGHLLGFA